MQELRGRRASAGGTASPDIGDSAARQPARRAGSMTSRKTANIDGTKWTEGDRLSPEELGEILRIRCPRAATTSLAPTSSGPNSSGTETSKVQGLLHDDVVVAPRDLVEPHRSRL